MATDFTYGGKQIVSGGPFKPNEKDMPSDARTRVDCYADIATIPNPYVGLKITVKVDETNNNKMTDYIVKSLKANSLGIANSLIDEVVRYVDYLGVNTSGSSGGGLTTEQAQHLQTAYLHSQSTHVQASDIPSLEGYATETFVTNNYASKNHNHSEYASSSHRHDASEIDNLPSGGSVSQEDINTAVNKYLTEHPVQSGATAEQAAQIQANKTAIGDSSSGLIKDVEDLKTKGSLSSEDLEKLSPYYTGTTLADILVEIYNMINNSSTRIPVESVVLNRKILTINKGDTYQLKATVLPDSATNKAIIWETNAPSIISIENGLVSALEVGVATITCSSVENNDIKDTCSVTVEIIETVKEGLLFSFDAEDGSNELSSTSLPNRVEGSSATLTLNGLTYSSGSGFEEGGISFDNNSNAVIKNIGLTDFTTDYTLDVEVKKNIYNNNEWDKIGFARESNENIIEYNCMQFSGVDSFEARVNDVRTSLTFSSGIKTAPGITDNRLIITLRRKGLDGSLFINGIHMATTTASTIKNITNTITIGGNNSISGINGVFYSAKMYNKALTDEEIKQNHKYILNKKRVEIEDLPIININGDISGVLADSTSTVSATALVSINGTSNDFNNKYAKIKIQGNSSARYPKKNLSIKLYDDELCTIKFKTILKDGWINTNKYHVKANFVDPSQARNIVCVQNIKKGWKEQLPGDALGVIDGFLVKVYNNDKYLGLYTINLSQEAKLFGVDETNPAQRVLRAEQNIPNSVCSFRALDNISIYWEDRIEETNLDRTSLQTLIEWVMSCSGDTNKFKSECSQHFNINHLLDYYIWVYFLAGVDSLAKNMTMATYDGRIWYIIPYDMDATLGNNWNGKVNFISPSIACPSEYQCTDSLLFELTSAAFEEEIKNRYAELRKTRICEEGIIKDFKVFTKDINDLRFEDALPNSVHEEAAYNLNRNYNKSITPTTDWFKKRILYCDPIFDYTE